MRPRSAASFVLLLAVASAAGYLPSAAAQPSAAAASLGGPLPPPLPLFPPDNWWNLDITNAPVDSNSAAFIAFIGVTRRLHPDFGGEESPGSVAIYGMPYAVVDATQTKKAVTFQYSDESDGVDHTTDQSFPFYPIPDEAISMPHWVEGGAPGNLDQRADSDRHLLIVDRDNKYLYELWNVFYDGASWQAGSGAFFDMKTNGRRPDGWTSADAAGLAILPGLVRYDEVYGPDEVGHAFRVTLRASNGYVYPASHRAGSNPSALPMGARLRLKPGKDISAFPAPMQKVFRAMKKYGLIMADNGSDMYVTGTFDTRWDNDVLNPAFAALTASDFEVVERGYLGPPVSLSIDDVTLAEGNAGTANATFTVTLSAPSSQTVTVGFATADGTAVAPGDYAATSGTLSFVPGATTQSLNVAINGDSLVEADETFFVTLNSPVNATLADGQGQCTITNDDVLPTLSIDDVWVAEGDSGTVNAVFSVTQSSWQPSATVEYQTLDGSAMQMSDYAPAAGTLSFTSGATQTIAVAVMGDTLDEPNETFFVLLSNPEGASIARGVGQGTILDDDGRPALCRPIATLPFTIRSEGSYCLVQGLAWSAPAGAAITIAADDVRLDLEGFTLDGSPAGAGTQAYGIYALNRRNLSVRNGSVLGFRRGLMLDDDSGAALQSSGHVIEGIHALGNLEAGIWVEGSGSVLRANAVIATGGTTALGPNADAYAIVVRGALSRILDNDVVAVQASGAGQAWGLQLLSASGSVVENNRIGNTPPGSAAATGIALVGGGQLLVVSNRLSALASGVVYNGATGLYQGNLTTAVGAPFTGGTDAGHNQ